MVNCCATAAADRSGSDEAVAMVIFYRGREWRAPAVCAI